MTERGVRAVWEASHHLGEAGRLERGGHGVVGCVWAAKPDAAAFEVDRDENGVMLDAPM